MPERRFTAALALLVALATAGAETLPVRSAQSLTTLASPQTPAGPAAPFLAQPSGSAALPLPPAYPAVAEAAAVEGTGAAAGFPPSPPLTAPTGSRPPSARVTTAHFRPSFPALPTLTLLSLLTLCCLLSRRMPPPSLAPRATQRCCPRAASSTSSPIRCWQTCLQRASKEGDAPPLRPSSGGLSLRWALLAALLPRPPASAPDSNASAIMWTAPYMPYATTSPRHCVAVTLRLRYGHATSVTQPVLCPPGPPAQGVTPPTAELPFSDDIKLAGAPLSALNTPSIPLLVGWSARQSVNMSGPRMTTFLASTATTATGHSTTPATSTLHVLRNNHVAVTLRLRYGHATSVTQPVLCPPGPPAQGVTPPTAELPFSDDIKLAGAPLSALNTPSIPLLVGWSARQSVNMSGPRMTTFLASTATTATGHSTTPAAYPSFVTASPNTIGQHTTANHRSRNRARVRARNLSQ